MKLQPDQFDVQSITAYGEGWVAINSEKHAGSLIISSQGQRLSWPVSRFEDLTEGHFEQLADIDCELIVFGSGRRNRFPPAAWLKALMARRIGLETMAWVLDQSMILLHPFMPFITEELWATTGTRAKLLVHTDWPAFGDLTDAEAAAEMSFVTGLIDEIRSARAQVHVPVGLKCDLVATELSPAARAAWTRNEALIRRMARIESFSEGHAPKGSIAIAMDGAAFALPLAGLIDITEEKARLQKALDKLTKEINGLKGRLDNPNFVKSAPEDVIIEARSNLEAREDEAAKIKAAVKRLAELG